MSDLRYEVILPSAGDRALAETIGDVFAAARTLVDDVSTHYGAARLARADLYVTTDGIYDNALTRSARERS